MCSSGNEFEIIAGTYEEFLLGYSFSKEKPVLVQTFASHDHSNSIRCVAQGGNYLASGAADDRILIYDLKLRKECCMLTHHNATVTCVKFTDDCSHLISGSSDGALAITSVGSWQLEKKWETAHKGFSISDIAIHSSGKLALTIGADQCVRTWNLVKGRQAYVINYMNKCKHPQSIEKVIWGPDGSNFILYGGKFTEIWNVVTGGAVKYIEHKQKVTSCLWLSEEELIVGYEDGQLALVKVQDSVMTFKTAHSSRVKALEVFKNWIISISSSGEIKVWTKKLREILKENTGCRLTCLCILPKIKIKKEGDESASEEDIDHISTPTVNSNKIVKRRVITEEEIDEISHHEAKYLKEDKKQLKKKSKKVQKIINGKEPLKVTE